MIHANNYVFPSAKEILTYNTSWSTENFKPYADVILNLFDRFKIDCEISGHIQSPTLTRFFLEPKGKTKVDSIIRLENDFRVSLNSNGVSVHIEEGKLVIDVPRKNKHMVFFGDLAISEAFQNAPKTAVALGMDIQSNVIVYDLRKAVHMLIAGQTGSGKSVLMHNIVASLLMKNAPRDLHMYIVDPKVLEFSRYAPLPQCTVTSNERDAEKILNYLCIEMDRRYQVLAASCSRDIDSYNEKNIDNPMRREIVIIDELADLMKKCGKTAETSIARLAQKARACGIHLIIATQYPVRDVVTGVIKQNIPTRICLSVTSSVASKVALDVTGGEDLLGNGDMLFLSNGALKPIRLQGGYISELTLDRLIEFLLDNNIPKAPIVEAETKRTLPDRVLNHGEEKYMVSGIFAIMFGLLGILLWPFSLMGIVVAVTGLESNEQEVWPLIVGLILCIAPYVIRFLPFLI